MNIIKKKVESNKNQHVYPFSLTFVIIVNSYICLDSNIDGYNEISLLFRIISNEF